MVEACRDHHLKSANFCFLRFNPGRGLGPGAPQRDAHPDILHSISHTEQEDQARRHLRVVWRFCEGSRERGSKAGSWGRQLRRDGVSKVAACDGSGSGGGVSPMGRHGGPR